MQTEYSAFYDCRLLVCAATVLALLSLAAPALASDEQRSARTEEEILDYPALAKTLRHSSALGLFTKLSLKRQASELFRRARAYHAGRDDVTLGELRARFNRMFDTILNKVRKRDYRLHAKIAASLDSLWETLADPVLFSRASHGRKTAQEAAAETARL